MNQICIGDCHNIMRRWVGEGVKVQTCVTSPPYWGLRDYGVAGQLGLEKTPEEYVANMVEVFHLVRDLMADDGTLWLNLGDCYATGADKVGEHPGGGAQGQAWAGRPSCGKTSTAGYRGNRAGHEGKHAYGIDTKGVGPMTQPNGMPIPGLKPKDLVGIPWRVAFALQSDGWYLRQDIIWSKPNPMPESVRDRCTKAQEYLFLLSKRERYYYDADAIAEPTIADHTPGNRSHKSLTAYETGASEHRTKAGLVEYAKRQRKPAGWDTGAGAHGTIHRDGRAQEVEYTKTVSMKRNKRSVWTVSTKPYSEAHFATFPPELIKPCILAGSRPGDIVFDPFMGSGTTAKVALEMGRRYLGCELNPKYVMLSADRIKTTAGLPFGSDPLSILSPAPTP